MLRWNYYTESSHCAVFQQRDAAECLEMILHKVNPQAREVRAYKICTRIYQSTNQNAVL